jgi:hypothetical protein
MNLINQTQKLVKQQEGWIDKNHSHKNTDQKGDEEAS